MTLELTPIPAIAAGGATTADLIARTRDLLAEAGADFYDDSVEILPWLNDGVVRMFANLDALLRMTDYNLVTGTSTVDPAYAVRKFAKLLCGTTELRPLTADEYMSLPAATGTPYAYCAEFTTAAGGSRIMLYPTPDADVTNGLRVFAWVYPAPLVSAAEGVTAVDPTWHAPFHFAPCLWAAAVLLRKDHRPEDAVEMESRFYGEIAAYKRWLLDRFPDRSEAPESSRPDGVHSLEAWTAGSAGAWSL